MAAKTAYVMLGHGSEDTNKKIIVPRGCTLVVEVHSGEINYLNGFDKIFNYNNKQIFLDPINNYKELVNKFSFTKRSFAIYEEGSICPEFSYKLLSCWEHGQSYIPKLNPDEIALKDSGVVEYPFTYIKPKYSADYSIFKKTDTSDIFIDKYRMSILPTQDHVSSVINKSRSARLGEVMNNIRSSDFNDILHIKQSELFKKLPPGVFYNFVCRATSDNVRENAVVTVHTLSGNNTRNGQVLKNSIRRPLKTRTRGHYFAPEISDQISEAEIHRKPYIGKLGFNNTNTIELVGEISKLKLEITKYRETIITDNQAIDRIKHILSGINKNNVDNIKTWNEYIDRRIGYINEGLEEIKKIESELKLKERELVMLTNTNPINTSTSNYLWEKSNNKWGKITIKNRNNKGSLPEGWKAYSTNKQIWYKAPSGKLQWVRPELTYKIKNNKGKLPTGWSLVSDGNAQWYKAPSGKVQWVRPTITYKNKNNKGNLPPGWNLVSDGNAQWYKAPSGNLQWIRPQIPNVIQQDPKTPVIIPNIAPQEPNTPVIIPSIAPQEPITPVIIPNTTPQEDSHPPWHKPVKAKPKTKKKKGFFSSMFA